MKNIKPGRWRHYKGGDYEVLYTARHSETLEPMVVYRALYGEGGVWVRPAAMWREPVTVNGATMQRFTYTGGMDISLRPAALDDYRATENITREAFWNLFNPGCDEHYLLHVLREDGAFLPELDIVAEKDGRIIGHIAYTRSHIAAPDGKRRETLTFGPVSVHPDYQRRGVGARLIFHTLDIARRMGYGAVLILGHPEYYPRFGFRRARDFGLTLPGGESFDAFMALELQPDSLAGLDGGVFHEAEVYHVDQALAEAFDSTFPHKEKKAKPVYDI